MVLQLTATSACQTSPAATPNAPNATKPALLAASPPSARVAVRTAAPAASVLTLLQLVHSTMLRTAYLLAMTRPSARVAVTGSPNATALRARVPGPPDVNGSVRPICATEGLLSARRALSAASWLPAVLNSKTPRKMLLRYTSRFLQLLNSTPVAPPANVRVRPIAF